jgi:hypothetical protein
MRHGTHVVDLATAELESALDAGPFHIALRAAINARGLSLQRVQHHLARRGVSVGVTSLSYWQQGARRPQRNESLRAVRALEDILQLPRESLIRLLAQSATVDAALSAARPHPSGAAAFTAVARLRAELELPADGGLRTLGHHECVRIGGRRELLGCDSQQVVRAHADGADRYLAVHHGGPGWDPGRVSVQALENCRTGRVRWCRESGVLVAELLFDARLGAGDTHVFRYAVQDGTAGPAHAYVRGFGFAGGQYVLQVRFAEEALPVRCHRIAGSSTVAAHHGHQEIALSSRHRCAHLVETHLRVGPLGIGWVWE